MEEINYLVDVVIVTYNSTNILESVFNNIYSQVNNIYIIDNNSKTKEELKQNLMKYEKVKLILNDQNLGLATAQNLGIKMSIENNSDFILFLDDDSKISENYIENMLEAYRNSFIREKIAILSPEIIQVVGNEAKKTKVQYLENENVRRVYLKQNETRDDVIFAISSGSIMRTEIVKKLGYFVDEYFIDEIDTEYCLRVMANNYKILVTSNAKLYQKYGNKSENNFLWFKVYTTNHSPLRLYYKYRNFEYNKKKYHKILPYQIKFLKKHKFFNFLRVVLFEEKKKEKIKNIIRGIKEGKCEC